MYERNLPFRTLTNTCMEAINTATSHGMNRFPSQTPIKFAILSWFIFTLLFEVFYSTGYMSLLTTPPLTSPIDSVDAFIERELYLGEYNTTSLTKQLKNFNHSTYTILASRIRSESSAQSRARHIKSGTFGYMVTKLANNYISNIPLKNIEAFVPMRLMKTCLIKYFTALAFEAHSPYSSYFSLKLAR